MEHHVYFWLKEGEVSPEERGEFELGLARLFEIESVAGGVWGVPADTERRAVSEQTWHYALSMQFASRGDHDRYQEDPAHEAFITRFAGLWEKVRVMDLAVLPRS